MTNDDNQGGTDPRDAGYLTDNRTNWDERVPAHVASPDYAVARFRADPAFVSLSRQGLLPRLPHRCRGGPTAPAER